ncbi:oxidoreductase [Dongia rigui]|uniref:FAD-dependent oxidoreductase n=1 Tax=Dongia rigui TaxID=940149 RepID=A0ABU5E047_9PROT|nr:FAD-dependent oxidoreductase [Dongia rigui]MDY0872948.1 FAD-dependent oxidoreductase [Dongia rigui]
MSSDARFDLLFTPFKLGPVTAPNRFYQVPHCSGMGHERPHVLAAMRGMKAEGGWGIVNTEYCTIHPSSDDTPFPIQTLWDDADIRQHAMMTEAVHKHGSLAGVELFLGGQRMANLNSRLAPMSIESMPVLGGDPLQTKALDKQDIADIRKWHVDAAKRAVTAGFDLVYIYACHHYLLHSFLSGHENARRDAYGGSPLNRVRIVRELLEAVKEAVGHKCAVALRWASNAAHPQEQDDWLEMTQSLSGLPDLWDLTVNDYSLEMGPSRFVKEGALEEQVGAIRKIVTGGVVTVGRYTSPESMLRLVKSGVADFIGAARPSIADPFLPNKIRENRLDDIRECIGCNICYAHNSRGAPIRCTQNATMGEEWRAGWHPEIITRDALKQRVLVIGAGPAGLEAARVLGARGYDVAVAEKSRAAGGRVNWESKLPGLTEWARVRDWRLTQINKMPNIELFLESEMGVDDVLDFGAQHVICATGSHWRLDGRGRTSHLPVLAPHADILSPEDVMRGVVPKGPVAVYDDDGFYLAPALADKLRQAGCEVHFISSAGVVAPWAEFTGDQAETHAHIVALGIHCHFNKSLSAFVPGKLELGCVYGGAGLTLDVATLVPVTSRQPDDDLYETLVARDHGLKSLTRIGDAEAPGLIAHAVYAGHRAGRLLGVTAKSTAPLRDRGAGTLPLAAE